MKQKRKRVMVIHPVGDPQLMPTLRGICDFANSRASWNLQFCPEMRGTGLRQLKDWPGHGIIALLCTRADASAAKSLGLPTVNLSGAIKNAGLPRVMVDQEAMGRLAAEHLMQCGLTHFAYYGERNMWYSQLRKRGFAKRLADEGRTFALLETDTQFSRDNPWFAWLRPMERWLRRLPKPVGLLAVHDYAAVVLLHICSQLGLRVPDDVAILGVGDDRSVCEFSEVSSIARSNREVGYQAAAVLEDLMSGKPPPEDDVLVPPEGVVPRRSTEIMAAADPRLLAAIQYIRDHAGEPFTIHELCGNLGASRRALEVSFRAGLGISPRKYLADARIQRAKKLLLDGRERKMDYIARCCGFCTLRAFFLAFRCTVGMTPAEFRRRMREERI